MIARIYLLLALLCTVGPAWAQGVGPRPDSLARVIYAQNAAEYARERRALAASGGRATRVGGQLRLRPPRGGALTLGDTLADGDSYHRFVYAGFLPALGLHVVAVSFYEGGSTLVVHDATGQTRLVPGPPVASPDGRRFASASVDLEAGYDPNRLEIWRADPVAGLRCEAVLDGEDRWGPDSVAWVSPDTLRFTRVALVQRTLERRRTRERIIRAGAGWVLESSGRRLTNRCSFYEPCSVKLRAVRQ